MAAYADYIVHKNTKLGSAGQLESLRKTLSKGKKQYERRRHHGDTESTEEGKKEENRLRQSTRAPGCGCRPFCASLVPVFPSFPLPPSALSVLPLISVFSVSPW
jgi:hypothetical protein